MIRCVLVVPTSRLGTPARLGAGAGSLGSCSPRKRPYSGKTTPSSAARAAASSGQMFLTRNRSRAMA